MILTKEEQNAIVLTRQAALLEGIKHLTEVAQTGHYKHTQLAFNRVKQLGRAYREALHDVNAAVPATVASEPITG